MPAIADYIAGTHAVFFLDRDNAGTDVSAEFTALVADAAAVGGTIIVPRGEYTISPVVIGAAGSYKSIRIVGEIWEGHFGDGTDYGSVLKLKDGSNGTMFTVPASDASDVGPSPFVAENLRIKGNRSNQTGTSYCVDFSNHTASANKQRSGHLRRCFIDGFRSGGVRAGTLRNAGVMEQVTVLNIGNGSSGSCLILGSASDWRFSKCDFGVALGPTIQDSGGSNVMYTDCNIFSAGTHGYKADTSSGDKKFINCSFDRNTQYGVHIDHATPYHWNFTGCRFTQNSLGATNTHSDLYINNNPNISLVNCSFMSWSGSERPKYAIEFAGTGAASMLGCTFDSDAFGTAISNLPGKLVQIDAGDFRFSAADVAATGSTQGDAAATTAIFNRVTGADAVKGVRLPAALAGRMRIVRNSSASALKVFPASGDAINAGATNASYSLAGSTSSMLLAVDDTTWVSLPLVAS